MTTDTLGKPHHRCEGSDLAQRTNIVLTTQVGAQEQDV